MIEKKFNVTITSPKITLSMLSTPVYVNAENQIIATLSPVESNVGITLYVGSDKIGTAYTSGSGVATLSYTFTKTGNFTITADGDGVSATLPVTVKTYPCPPCEVASGETCSPMDLNTIQFTFGTSQSLSTNNVEENLWEIVDYVIPEEYAQLGPCTGGGYLYAKATIYSNDTVIKAPCNYCKTNYVVNIPNPPNSDTISLETTPDDSGRTFKVSGYFSYQILNGVTPTAQNSFTPDKNGNISFGIQATWNITSYNLPIMGVLPGNNQYEVKSSTTLNIQLSPSWVYQSNETAIPYLYYNGDQDAGIGFTVNTAIWVDIGSK